ncbi:transposable element tcb2 transposase [Trichonephila clavipes]|nr:transposable element tcb2 transposase [Trichonephila clavipes]
MGPLIRLDTTLISDRYVSILSDQLHPFMSIVHSDGHGEFQQDNATPHMSRIAIEWLQEHSSDSIHFRWPPKSPDRNSIEYIWNALKTDCLVALWAGGIIGPYFFKNDEGHNVTVNGDRYRAMITNFFFPELNNHDVQELWFQQNGATCHTARATINLLTFGDRLISRFGPVNWPPRSCD